MFRWLVSACVAILAVAPAAFGQYSTYPGYGQPSLWHVPGDSPRPAEAGLSSPGTFGPSPIVPATAPAPAPAAQAAAEPLKGPSQTPAPKVSELPVPACAGQPSPCCPSEFCAPCVAGCREVCGPPGRFWFDADYLLWWVKGSPLPPLVTTSPLGTPLPQVGVLGGPNTSILVGNGGSDTEERSGGRFGVGYWLDDCQTIGVEANFLFLGNRGTTFAASSGGNPILARPFFNTFTGAQDAQLIAFPGLLAGSITATSRSTSFWGAEPLGRLNLCCGCGYRIDLLGGFRYLKWDENLDIAESLTAFGPAGLVPPGTHIGVLDSFDVQNDFYGGEIGGVAEFRRGGWILGILGTVALGDSHEVVRINGSTQVSVPGQPTAISTGGLLAQRTNIGRFTHDTFAVVPEVGLNIGYQITSHLEARIGYTFLYWSDVARPGDQIDLGVNRTQIPPGTLVGNARPTATVRGADWWAQGINLGFTFRY